MSDAIKTPVEITICIASAHEAIEYWLNNQVFKDEVNIESVQYLGHENCFKIKFNRVVTPI